MRSASLSTRALPLYALYLLLTGIGLLALVNIYETDANFVTYRFAANLAAGHGLVYRMPGADVTTYPLLPLLLAAAAPLDAGMVGWAVNIIAIGTGALFMARLVGRMAGFAYLLALLVQPSPVVTTMLALALAGLEAVQSRRWVAAGSLMGAAVLAEPSASALAALALILALREGGAVWRFALPAALIPAAALGLLSLSLGTVGIVSVVPGIFSLALPFFALYALARRRGAALANPYSAVLAAWSAVIALFSTLNGAAPLAAILPGLIALAVTLPVRGAVFLALLIDVGLGLGLALPAHFPDLDQPLATLEIGEWLAANTGPEATIATDEIGVLSYVARRPVIDMSGRLLDNPIDRFFIFRHAPDVVVLRDGQAIPWKDFAVTYAHTRQSENGRLHVFQRVVNWSPLDDHGVDVNFSARLGRQDLRLTNVAIGNTLHPGDLVRIRLDWELVYAPSFEIEIKLDLFDEQFTGLNAVLDKLPPEAWQAGQMSTYHVLTLPGDAPAGRASLFLNVGARAGSLGTLQIAEVSVAH